MTFSPKIYETLRRNLLKATDLETYLLSDEDTFVSLMSSPVCKIVKAMGTVPSIKSNGYCVYCAFKEREQRNVSYTDIY